MNARLAKCSVVLMMASVLVIGSVLLSSHPRSIIADSPTQPQTLPPPMLSDANAADAPYGGTPVIDGLISPGEYAGAHQLTFPTYGGDMEVFIRQNAITLYIAIDSPDATPFPYLSGGGPGPAFQVFLDTKHDGGLLPQPDDYRLTINKGNGLFEDRGTGSSWNVMPIVSWTAQAYAPAYGWQAEYAIDLTKAGITQTGSMSIGLAIAEVWTPAWPHDWYWPSAGFYLNPSSWGNLASSSDWSTFYWKPGPYEDYAPSGLPDFDQKQSNWTKNGRWSHDGPAAAADSLWWFDSKFETPDHTPPAISDTYRLITAYGAWDDHSISNVVPLVNDLAANYFGTNRGITGTSIISMFYGVDNYLRTHNLWDDYRVTLVPSPTSAWVANEVMRSEDVVLLMGFYEFIPAEGRWARVGGHYVTVAGVDANHNLIAFSDPITDATEAGPAIGVGRVLSGTLIPHQPIPGHTSLVHNDAGNISHDGYVMLPTNSPGGLWGPGAYPWEYFIDNFGVNPHPSIPMETYQGGPVQIEVEYALAVSPYTWKASGYQDYAPNGLPDIDQKQDGWVSLIGPGGPQWSFCGPVAAANSLWWFDSKFESSPITPPAISDHYPLINAYGAWDDHDPLNVDDPGTGWPPLPPGGVEFVEDLALHFGTDMLGSGTIITNMYTGLDQYLIGHQLRNGYVITLAQSPDFWWVAEEVEQSEDVIVLLGFYASTGGAIYERVGGHYVTVPGVDKKNGFIAFSDPYWDRAETTWPYANVTGPIVSMGRVANGSILGHIPIPGHPITYHNDTGNVSHDMYPVAQALRPGGGWGPLGYIQSTTDVSNFFGMNGNGFALPGQPAVAEVEWVIAVSPVADVWINKVAKPITVTNGDRITFTLTFGNNGSLTAQDMLITDTLPTQLINPTWGASIPITLITGTQYVWQVPDLAWQQGGAITISGRISATNLRLIVTNTASIGTSSVEQYQLPSLGNNSYAEFVIVNPNIDVQPTAISVTLAEGVIGTRPITVANTGATTLTWSLAEVPAVTWLGETPTGGDVPAGRATPITATFDATGLSQGAYTTTLRFTSDDPDRPTVDVPMTLTVPPPDIDVRPASIAITLTDGVTATRPITVANLGQSTLIWNVGEIPAAAWLSESSTGGNVPAGSTTPLTLTFDTTGLASNTYTTTLRFASNDPDEPQVDVPITLTVPPPDIDVRPASIAITLTGGLTATRSITVVNLGQSTLAWNVTEVPTATWLSEIPISGSVPSGSSTPITVAFNSAGLSGDVYTTALRFASNDPDEPQVNVPISLTVIAPTIDITPTSIAITLTPNITVTQWITVANTGSATLAWSLAEDPSVGWLSESPVGGSTLPGNTATITTTFNAVGLTSGIYTTTLRFNSNDPAHPQIDVPITLTVHHVLYLPVVLKNA
jgi:uncharacterized repeat protein (TIGR01451 family)